MHKSVFAEILSRNIWAPGMVDAKTLKLANTRVIKRRERASGGGKPKAAAPDGGAGPAPPQ